MSDPSLTTAEELLRDLWEAHVRYEFATRNTEDTLATMVEDAYVNHIPVPVAGRETARKALDPRLPSNALIERADRARRSPPAVPPSRI